jgi:hypothetical protein
MNRKSKVIGFAAAAVLSLGIGTGVMAQDPATDEVVITVTGGALVPNVEAGEFSEADFESGYQSTGTLSFEVQDQRVQTAWGDWTATASVGDFANVDETDSFEASIALSDGALNPTGQGVTTTANGSLESGTSGSTLDILVADENAEDQEYSVDYGAEADMTGAGGSGEYTATVTLTVAAD